MATDDEAIAILQEVLSVPFTWREETTPEGTRGFVGTAPGGWRCAVGITRDGVHLGAVGSGSLIVLLPAAVAAELFEKARRSMSSDTSPGELS